MIPILIGVAAIGGLMALFVFVGSEDPSTPTCDDPGCTCTGLPGDETHL